MFEYSLAHWLTFLSAAFVLEIVPGPDMAFMLGHTVRHGRRGGFIAMLGVWTGALLHIAMTVLGLSALLAGSPAAFSVIKWMGAAYLVWLGLRSLLAAGNDGDEVAAPPTPPGSMAIFRQGVLVDALNPKSALFFLAFIPQFVVPGAGPVAAQLLLHGLLLIAVAAVIEPAYILITAVAARRFRVARGTARWLDRGLGALFIGLGLRLAALHR